jgi:hypothetical protein
VISVRSGPQESRTITDLVVAERAWNNHVVAAGADHVAFGQVYGTHDGFADVHQLPVPPHLLGRSTPPYTCAQSLYELVAIHPYPPPNSEICDKQEACQLVRPEIQVRHKIAVVLLRPVVYGLCGGYEVR